MTAPSPPLQDPDRQPINTLNSPSPLPRRPHHAARRHSLHHGPVHRVPSEPSAPARHTPASDRPSSHPNTRPTRAPRRRLCSGKQWRWKPCSADAGARPTRAACIAERPSCHRSAGLKQIPTGTPDPARRASQRGSRAVPNPEQAVAVHRSSFGSGQPAAFHQTSASTAGALGACSEAPTRNRRSPDVSQPRRPPKTSAKDLRSTSPVQSVRRPALPATPALRQHRPCTPVAFLDNPRVVLRARRDATLRKHLHRNVSSRIIPLFTRRGYLIPSLPMHTRRRGRRRLRKTPASSLRPTWTESPSTCKLC